MTSVALRDVHKRYGATQALRGASLELRSGEVHALLGENGAGKTTLVRALYGVVRPDRGSIEIDGRRVEISGPRRALELGIGMVHQHFMLVPALSVAENLALGEALPALVSRASLRDRARAVLARYGLEHELDLLERLRGDGVTVVLITHKLEEITAVCQRVTVLRQGETVASREVAGLTAEQLGRLMVGEALPAPGRPGAAEPGEVALRLRGLCAPGLDGVDLELRAGEILALAGIDGNGQAPLEELLAGVAEPQAGSIEVERPPLAVLSGDRQRTGLVLDLSVAENLVLPQAARGGARPVFRRGLLLADELARAGRGAIERFEIRATPGAPARSLSGGNQQKLCVARSLFEEPRVLVAVNPTRGLDVSATASVREELRRQALAGTAVLLVSTDLDEVLELGDRVAVLFRGRLLRPPAAARPTRERIGRLMLGAGDST